MAALGRYEDPAVAAALLTAYPHHAEPWRRRARELFWSRASWARLYLAEIDRGKLSPGEATLDQLGGFPALQAPDLARIIRKHWGTSRGPTREERLAEVRRLKNDLRAGPGDPARGHRLFRDRCASCHRLHGEGETIGPDLTFANRKDRDFLLVSLVDPSGVVRKEFQTSQVATKDGRVLSGLIVEQSPETLTLCDPKAQRTRIARADIEEVKGSEVSLMPESLYKEFNPQELRDLFRFLQNDPPEDRKKSL
jgi:putative heme-binding domain-containing protein